MIVSQQVQKLINKNEFYSLHGQSLIAISTAYSYKAQYDSSTAYSFRALEVAKSKGDTMTIIDANNNLGIDFLYQDELKMALKYFQQVRDLSLSFGDTLRWAHALNNMGLIHGYEGRLDKELELYVRSGDLFKLIDEKEGYGNVLLNMGTVHTAERRFTKAQELYLEALSIFREISYTSAIAQTHMNLAENYLGAGDLKLAEQEALITLKIVVDNNFDQDRIYSLELLAEISQRRGDLKQALDYQKKMYELKEQIFNSEKSLQIRELQTKYDTEVKEVEIERLTLQNEFNTIQIAKTRWQMAFIVAGSLSLVALIIFLYWQKTKREKADKEEQALRFEALQKRYMELLNGPAKMDLDIDLSTFNEKLVNPLTEREYDVLKNSMSGKTNQEIADTLFVSLSTIKFHMGNIYNKLGVNNKKEALEYVVKSS